MGKGKDSSILSLSMRCEWPTSFKLQPTVFPELHGEIWLITTWEKAGRSETSWAQMRWEKSYHPCQESSLGQLVHILLL